MVKKNKEDEEEEKRRETYREIKVTMEKPLENIARPLEKGLKRAIFGKRKEPAKIPASYKDMRYQTLKQRKRYFGGRI